MICYTSDFTWNKFYKIVLLKEKSNLYIDKPI